MEKKRTSRSKKSNKSPFGEIPQAKWFSLPSSSLLHAKIAMKQDHIQQEHAPASVERLISPMPQKAKTCLLSQRLMGLPENRVYTAYPKNCNREKDEPMDLGTQVAVFFQTKPQLESFSPLSYWSFVSLLAAFLRFSPLPKHKKVTIPLAQCCGYGLSLRVHPHSPLVSTPLKNMTSSVGIFRPSQY